MIMIMGGAYLAILVVVVILGILTLFTCNKRVRKKEKQSEKALPET